MNASAFNLLAKTYSLEIIHPRGRTLSTSKKSNESMRSVSYKVSKKHSHSHSAENVQISLRS